MSSIDVPVNSHLSFLNSNLLSIKKVKSI
jgi:hypothetical protein